MLATKQLMGSIVGIKKKILLLSMATINYLVTDILQKISFVLTEEKQNHTGLEQLEGE